MSDSERVGFGKTGTKKQVNPNPFRRFTDQSKLTEKVEMK